jgi:uncharacterized protein YndB with AHSA1/START domain
MEPLELTFTVACPPAHAFAVWAERTGLWWPPGHSVSGAPALVAFEPRAGGRIFEREAGGAEHDWGEVLAWEPPRRLVYLWHLRADRSDATEVEIRFDEDAGGAGTRVTIEHRGWERLGARAAERRERNRRGWSGLLPHYMAACQSA